MKTIYKLLLILFSSFVIGDQAPLSAEEINKAPDWPSKSTYKHLECKKVDESIFLDFMNKGEDNESFKYRIKIQSDLNFDGLCEVIATQSYTCGTGGCGNEAFQYINGKFNSVGMWGGFELNYLAKHNGWAQIETWSRSGMTQSVRMLSRFEGGIIKFYRVDKFEAPTESSVMKYKETKYK